jgi:hypothetical protein
MALTRDQILAVNDDEQEEVQIPAWGGSVWVRVLSGAERDQWESSMQSDDDATPAEKQARRFGNLRARSAVLSVCDEQGAPLFVWQDAEWLGKKSSKALDKIWDVFLRINAIRKEEVEELTKNSETTPNDASGSTLP